MLTILSRLSPSLSPRITHLPSLSRSFASSLPRNMKILPVPVRNDNYAYLLIDDVSNTAAAVDPYDVSKVRAAADNAGVQIVAAITTHHHHDHSGGNQVCPRPVLNLQCYCNLSGALPPSVPRIDIGELS
ncbi:hypothetical protein ONZ51_g13582 [Trametes cubensis]|uniref:Metallo-beta-lactamase domain-containing protein n=1 Tax=Trametes cubensis TaxID=1111947 RepID=A0AAD7TEH5_9APHY|nr:hypothetical protein ONZ51_g13582 [Trametes cubensis]